MAGAEARFPDVVPGAEARIVWAGAAEERTTLSVVYLHGFSATHRDTAPLAEIVASRLGANLYLARLTGHGRGGDAMGEAEAADWLRDAREARALGGRLGDRVVLMGHSTGATLCTWLAAAEPGSDLLALVLLSPNFAPADPAAAILLWPWGGLLARIVEGNEREWEPANELQAKYFTTRYPTRALLPMMALVDRTRSLPVERMRFPALVLVDPEDRVVSADATRRIVARFGGATELVEVPDTGDPEGHVLAGDILSPGTTERLAGRIVAFLRDIPMARPAADQSEPDRPEPEGAAADSGSQPR